MNMYQWSPRVQIVGPQKSHRTQTCNMPGASIKCPSFMRKDPYPWTNRCVCTLGLNVANSGQPNELALAIIFTYWRSWLIPTGTTNFPRTMTEDVTRRMKISKRNTRTIPKNRWRLSPRCFNNSGHYEHGQRRMDNLPGNFWT